MLEQETLSLINKFVKKTSNNNIICIRHIGTKAFLDGGGFNKQPLVIKKRLILECHCRDHTHFIGVESLGKQIYLLFKNQLKGYDDVYVEYSYSMYCSKD